MDRPDACRTCGNELPAGRRKLKSYCSYSCRGQNKALEATTDHTGLIRSKNAKQNKALQCLKRQSVAGFSFAKVNSCTVRLDRPNKRGAGWLMEVAWPSGGRQRWVARVGDWASEPLSLDAAKQAAIAFLREKGKADPPDFIAELNQIAANEVDRAVLAQERKRWPVNIMGGGNAPRGAVDSELREAILSTEVFSEGKSTGPMSLQGDDYPLKYNEDGYPKLPGCLRRAAEEEKFSDAA